MLGKLIKYDLKSLTRIMVIIHGFLLVAVIIGRVFLTGKIRYDASDLNRTLFLLAFIFYGLLFSAIASGTYIVIGVRFYKSVFSDEGYLTNTLPVTRGRLLFSKTLTAGIWAIIDILIIFLCCYILTATPYIIQNIKLHKKAFLSELGFTDFTDMKNFILLLAAFSVFCVISSVVMTEASVIIGQLFGNHRILGAVAVYFSINTLLSLVSVAILSVNGMFANMVIISGDEKAFNFRDYMLSTFEISSVIALITAVILYIVSYYIMNRKMNLA